jgi:hypothetical protein
MSNGEYASRVAAVNVNLPRRADVRRHDRK